MSFVVIMWILAVSGCIIVAVAVYVVSTGRYYGRLFSMQSLREFHQMLSAAIAAAQRKEQDQPPSAHDGTAFVTSSDFAAAVTFYRDEDGNPTAHISLSERGRHTTHAVCSHFARFVLAMFGNTKVGLLPLYTRSGVHHLIVHLQTPAVQLEDFEATLARFANDHRPITFRYEKMESDQTRCGALRGIGGIGATLKKPAARFWRKSKMNRRGAAAQHP